jgi:NAD(P)-dependent dehydrogenase (short-subunit alcohol dehydrogenase family)
LTGHNVDVTDHAAVMKMVEGILANQGRMGVLEHGRGGTRPA